jgi:hypothetical protein
LPLFGSVSLETVTETSLMGLSFQNAESERHDTWDVWERIGANPADVVNLMNYSTPDRLFRVRTRRHSADAIPQHSSILSLVPDDA